MVVVEVAGEQTPEVALAQHDALVRTLPPDTPDHPLRIGILPGTPRGSEHLLHAQARHAPLKARAIHTIPVPEQDLGAVSRGKASTSCWAVHWAVGCSVTLKWATVRRSWARTIRTKRTLKLTVGTVKKSRATSSVRWLFKKARRAGEDGRHSRTRYVSTVDFATG